ncbi:GntR family transcriptional regulator [Micromonospora sp. KC721]|uniref:GntR family transcriptional regulator n=1 Tax=Micromonospora sp. KC721 TaxID=2530380 RepID=UPI00352FEABD
MWHLSLSIGSGSRETLAVQLRNALRRQIEEGALRPGTCVPSGRQLAADLGVSRSALIPDQTPTPEVWDLRVGGADVSTFPPTPGLDSLRQLGDQLRGPPGAGRCPSLRPARWSGTPSPDTRAGSEGILTCPERLMITSGFAQGLALLCRVRRDRAHDAVGPDIRGSGSHRRRRAAPGGRPGRIRTASWSTTWPPAASGPCSPSRPASSRPGWGSPRDAGANWSSCARARVGGGVDPCRVGKVSGPVGTPIRLVSRRICRQRPQSLESFQNIDVSLSWCALPASMTIAATGVTILEWRRAQLLTRVGFSSWRTTTNSPRCWSTCSLSRAIPPTTSPTVSVASTSD